MISWVGRVRERITNQVEGDGNNRNDYCREDQQVWIIQEIASCVSKQNTQRRCVDVKTQTKVRQGSLHVDGTWDRQSQSQNDYADQLWQQVLDKNTIDWCTQCSGRQVKLTVTINHNQISNVTCHYQPVECNQRYTHDGEALTDHQSDQGHVNDLRNAVDDIVQLGKEGVQLTDIAPQTADGDTNQTLTDTYDQRKFDRSLRCVPYLAPVVDRCYRYRTNILHLG